MVAPQQQILGFDRFRRFIQLRLSSVMIIVIRLGRSTPAGCPQTLFKFNPAYDDVLRRILESDPQGDLTVIESRNASWGNALRARWRMTFPDVDRRVRFGPSQPRNDFLHLLTSADVMLDPFPFCGGNTTYEALAWEVKNLLLWAKSLCADLIPSSHRKRGLSPSGHDHNQMAKKK